MIHPSVTCVPAPHPLAPYSNKTHGNGHLCGNSRPLDCVWTRLVWLRGMCLKPPSLRDAAFDGFYLEERNNVCLSHVLVLRNYKKREKRIALNPVLWSVYMSHTSSWKNNERRNPDSSNFYWAFNIFRTMFTRINWCILYFHFIAIQQCRHTEGENEQMTHK